jgi:hypothetical protein
MERQPPTPRPSKRHFTCTTSIHNAYQSVISRCCAVGRSIRPAHTSRFTLFSRVSLSRAAGRGKRGCAHKLLMSFVPPSSRGIRWSISTLALLHSLRGMPYSSHTFHLVDWVTLRIELVRNSLEQRNARSCVGSTWPGVTVRSFRTTEPLCR